MSLLTLTKIANSLEIAPGYFFEKKDNKSKSSNLNNKSTNLHIVNKGNNKVMSPSNGITYFLLTPNLDCKVQFLYALFEPHTKTAEKAYKHIGEEYAYILKGKMQIEISGKRYKIEEGDSIVFDPNKLHRLINPYNEKAEAICVNSPPWF